MVALLYSAIWTAWSLTVLYANVAGDRVRPATMLAALLLIGVMTAASPLHENDRANAFVGAFLLLRLMLSRGSSRTGRLLGSWPLLQLGGMSALWLASLWVQAPAKYVVWAAALLVDLLLSSMRAAVPPGDRRGFARGRDGRRRSGRQTQDLAPVDVDRSHLDERLGLFVIIVLGESVLRLVQSAADTPWTSRYVWSALAVFALLAGLWRLAFAHGFSGAPHVSLADLPPRAGLPLHLLSTLGLVLVAAGVGDVLARTDESPSVAVGWLLAGGLALHLAVGLGAGLAGGARRRWLVGRAGACTLVALLVGLVAPRLGAVAFLWLAAVPAVWAGTAPVGARRT